MFQALSRSVLRLLGWTLSGNVPSHLKKYVIIVVPHTSNWDFPLGILVRSALGIHVNYLGKSSLFRVPFGWIFRSLGGFPVDRSQRNNYVDYVVGLFESNEKFGLTIAPEGTRKKTNKLKTGFYYIAKKAKVPIIMCKFDYENSVVSFAEPFETSGSMEDDFIKINHYFNGVKGKIANNSYQS